MSDIASSLRSARAYLDMNVKSVASALRMSDKTLTQIEKFGDPDDPKVAELIDFYEDLGLKFVREGKEIRGILHSDEVRKLAISAAKGPNPDEDIESLRRAVRIINGLVYNLRRVEKTKANIADTMEVHFPVSARDFVKKIISDWLSERPYVEIISPDGKKQTLDKGLIEKLL
ncbi:hypothetical protein [Shimia sp. MMG029]|uniref:hypothetical protein n=1 Tax=Shimia sp. MMG029 TaxID=3021978 RepID=UPI0022FE6C5F|nr:hypothetical protein [Shimia sp. MMG029]MDA5558690.1 hypothetical protein [Shimia sp. MMG029]